MIESIAKAFQDGEVFMIIITVVLGFGILVMVERGYYLMVKFNVDGRKFFNEVKKLIQVGDLDAARKFCGNAPLPRILGAGIGAAGKGERAIQNAVDEEALAVIPLVEKRIHYLAMIANVATLSGLLGTILGLISAFGALEYADPSQKAQALAGGISMAMYTTAYGLMAAIPCMIGYSVLQSKAGKVIDEIDEYSVKMINLFQNRAKREG